MSTIYSVATVMTDVFLEICYSVGDIICKIMIKFEKLEHVNNRWVTFWSEEIRPLVVCIFDWLLKAVIITAFCNMSNIWTTNGLISSDQNVTHRLSTCSSFSNFIIIL